MQAGDKADDIIDIDRRFLRTSGQAKPHAHAGGSAVAERLAPGQRVKSAAIDTHRNFDANDAFAAQAPQGRILMADQEYSDAIALLKADHRKVEALFEQFEAASGSATKKKLAHQICVELKVHTAIEEEIFYPAFEGKIESDTLAEAYVEHDGAKILVNDIEAGGPSDDFYDAKVKVLSEEILHHVHEEEMRTEGMFAQCRKTDVDLVALRDAMLARKQELMAQAQAAGLPPAEPRTINLQPA